MNTAPKESVPQTNAGEREREPEVRKCRYCGEANQDFLHPKKGRYSNYCWSHTDCRNRCASALAEQDTQLAEERVEVEVWRDAVSAITAILTNTKSEGAALREMLGKLLSALTPHDIQDFNLIGCQERAAALIATKPGSAHKEEE